MRESPPGQLRSDDLGPGCLAETVPGGDSFLALLKGRLSRARLAWIHGKRSGRQ